MPICWPIAVPTLLTCRGFGSLSGQKKEKKRDLPKTDAFFARIKPNVIILTCQGSEVISSIMAKLEIGFFCNLWWEIVCHLSSSNNVYLLGLKKLRDKQCQMEFNSNCFWLLQTVIFCQGRKYFWLGQKKTPFRLHLYMASWQFHCQIHVNYYLLSKSVRKNKDELWHLLKLFKFYNRKMNT